MWILNNKKTLNLPKGCIAVTCLASLSTNNWADEWLTESDLLSPVPYIQSVTGLKQQLTETPAATTIIDQDLIKASGAINIVDVMRLVPGFQVYHINANRFGVVSHGQGSEYPGRLEVMIDGRSVYLPLLSIVDWSALGITLNDIDYIEVVRGSNVPTQGSNAFLGSINIITKDPLQRAKRQVRVTAGSNEWLQSQFQTSGQFGEIDFGLSGELLHNEGFGPGYTNGDDDKTNPIDFDDGADIGQISLVGSYTPTLTDSFNFSLGFTKGGIAIGKSHNADDYGDRDVTTHYQSLRWNRIIDAETELEVHAYHNYLKYDHKYSFNVAENALSSVISMNHPAFDIDDGIEDGTSQRFDLSATLTRDVNANNRLIFGAGARYEVVESDILFGKDTNEVDEYFYRLHGNWEHHFNSQWVMNAGVMIEDNSVSDTLISPRLGINYKLKEGHVFRGIVGQAFRSPSLLESNEYISYYLPEDPAFGAFSGYEISRAIRSTDELKAERINTAELGYTWYSLDRKNSFDTRIYVEHVTDVIDLINNRLTPPDVDLIDNRVLEWQNNPTWTSRGADFQYQTQITDKNWLHLAYSYLDIRGNYPQSLIIPENIHPASRYAPQHTLAAVFSHQLDPDSDLSFSLYSMSERKWHGASDTAGYTRLDARYARNIKLPAKDQEATLELIIHNLLDEYDEYDDQNVMDTRAYLRLTFDF